MKITIITVCYNAVNVLEKTICSVLNQSYKNIEYIILPNLFLVNKDKANTKNIHNIVKRLGTGLNKP